MTIRTGQFGFCGIRAQSYTANRAAKLIFSFAANAVLKIWERENI